jgi:beta-glucanase (GH16 family)
MKRIYNTIILAFLLFSSSAFGARTATVIVYEAETGVKSSLATQFIKDSPNASGGKVVSDFSSWNAQTDVRGIDGINGGVVTLTIRYSNKNLTNGFLTCLVNNVKAADITFPTTGSADTFTDISLDVTLVAGTGNNIRIQNLNYNLPQNQGVSGGVDIDKFTITTKNDVLVSSIGLIPTALSFTKRGDKTVLAPTILPKLASNRMITWSSTNTAVATVSQTGEVTAIGNGDALIIVKANDAGGIQASCAVNVNSATFKLVWSDEFNGTGLVDDTKWSYEEGFKRNDEVQKYIKKDTSLVRQKNGVLEIVERDDKPTLSKYVSGSIITQYKHSWSYGRIEGSIKLPLVNATWACFWTQGENSETHPWPKNGEIDIFEHLNCDSFLHTTAHWFDPTPREIKHSQEGTWRFFGYPSISDIPGISDLPYTVDVTSWGLKTDKFVPYKVDVTQYHLYSMEWTPNMIKWFIDGVPVHQMSIKEGVNNTFAFHKPQYLLLNMPLGGKWAKAPDATTKLPATMFVDFVRVYEWIPDAPQPVSFIEVDQPTLNVISNHPVQLTTSVYPYNAANKSVVWSSSDNYIATVSATGVVSGLRYGSATITATTVDGGKSSSSLVTVLNPAGINYVENPGFEIDQTVVQVPKKWFEWSATAAGSSTSTVVQGGASTGNSKLTFAPAVTSNVTVSQTIDSLPRAYYSLKVWVRSSGSLPSSYLAIKDYGGSTQYAFVNNAPSTWTLVTIPKILITTGKCGLEFSLTANAGQWIEIDDVSLTINPETILTSDKLEKSDKPQIYPTLVKDFNLHISNPHSDKSEIVISDMSGKKMYSQKLDAGNSVVKTSFLKSGIYIVNIISDKDVYTQKIVIQ